MAINTLAFKEQFTDKLDKAIVQKAVTGFFADNDLGAKFIDAATVSIPELTVAGLTNYNKDTGFNRGAVTVSRRTVTLAMDRARTFSIDAVDSSDTGIADIAGKTAAEVVRTQSVPEVDAYVLSKLGAYAKTNSQTVSIGTSSTLEADIIKMFNDAQTKIGDALDFDENLVCFVDSKVWAAMCNSTAISKQIVVSDFKRGEINTKVKTLNDVAIIPVSGSRMYTAYTFNDGTTSGQTAGGFAKTSAAEHIGMLMLPKAACQLVRKHEVTRIFSPDENQTANAWKIDYRIHYDAFINNPYKTGIYAYTYAQATQNAGGGTGG